MYHVVIGSVHTSVYELSGRHRIVVSLGVQRVGYPLEGKVVEHHRVEVGSALAARTLMVDVVSVCPMPGDEGWLDFETGYWSPQLKLF